MSKASFLKGGRWSYKPSHGHRSGLEDTIAAQIKSYEGKEVYESHYVNYEVPASVHKYTPDFILQNGIIIEAKGLFEADDRKKHILIKSQYPNLDIRFVFSNPRNKLYKGSKTTYADWCVKYGFQYASKTIPPSWFKEKKRRNCTVGLLKKESKK